MSIFLIFTEREISDSVVSSLGFSLLSFFPFEFTIFAKVLEVWSLVIESMGQEKRAFILPRHTLLAPADFASLSYSLLYNHSGVSVFLSLFIPLPVLLLHCIEIFEILLFYKSSRVQLIISGAIRGRLDRGWRDIDCFIYLTVRFVTLLFWYNKFCKHACQYIYDKNHSDNINNMLLCVIYVCPNLVLNY